MSKNWNVLKLKCLKTKMSNDPQIIGINSFTEIRELQPFCELSQTLPSLSADLSKLRAPINNAEIHVLQPISQKNS